MIHAVNASLSEHIECAQQMNTLVEPLQLAGERLVHTIQSGGCASICGNGGSAADAQHFAAELTGRFERERRAWPAIALTTNTSALAAIGNDYGFDQVFQPPLQALGMETN